MIKSPEIKKTQKYDLILIFILGCPWGKNCDCVSICKRIRDTKSRWGHRKL